MHRPFRVPQVPLLPIVSAVSCVALMASLAVDTWIRFLVWMALGVVVYYAYGKQHSLVGKRADGSLGFAEEELKSTWRAEEDSGWVGPRSARRSPHDEPDRPAGPGRDQDGSDPER